MYHTEIKEDELFQLTEGHRCREYGDGFVCDLRKDHKDFHFDAIRDLHWSYPIEYSPRRVPAATFLIMGASALSMLAFIGWLIVRLV